MTEKPISKALKTARSVRVVKPGSNQSEVVSPADAAAAARQFLKEIRKERSKQ